MDFSQFLPSLDFEKAAKYPSATVLVLANLVPLFGVLALGWSVSDIIFVYWAENVIVGLYTVLKMLAILSKTKEAVGLFLVPFFCVHYGIFTSVHGVFVISMFGFPETGLLPTAAALAALLASHGFSFYENFLKKEIEEDGSATVEINGVPTRVSGALNRSFWAPYPRIIVLHMTIILGGFFATALGAPTVALAIMVALKTAVDLGAHLAERMFASAKTAG